MSAKPKMQPLAAPLALPVIGSNLDPVSVPHDAPAPVAVVQNDYTAAAHQAAEMVIKASLTRYAAWTQLCVALPDGNAIPQAALAFKTELFNLGYKRAETEANEWKAFAIVYFYDQATALHIVDGERMVTDRNSKGEAIKLPNGEVRKRRPTASEVLEDVRSTRDLLVKAGKVPAALVPKNSGKRKAESTNNPKLTSVQLDACLRYIDTADSTQFSTILARLLTRIRTHEGGKEYASALIKQLREMQAAQGWIKTREHQPATA